MAWLSYPHRVLHVNACVPRNCRWLGGHSQDGRVLRIHLDTMGGVHKVIIRIINYWFLCFQALLLLNVEIFARTKFSLVMFSYLFVNKQKFCWQFLPSRPLCSDSNLRRLHPRACLAAIRRSFCTALWLIAIGARQWLVPGKLRTVMTSTWTRKCRWSGDGAGF